MKKVLLIFFIWVLVVNLFGVFVLNRFNLKTDNAYIWITPERFSQSQQWNPISLHDHWDSFWYLDIAKNGYSFAGVTGPGRLYNIVFFPLYPFLIRAAAFLTAGNFVLAGWLISLVFLFLALFYFLKLVKKFHPEIDSELPLIFLLIFPTAFFLNAIYTESLFLFLSLAAFFYALKKNYFLAGIFGFFASLTRVTGILLFIPIAWEYFQNCGWRHLFNLRSSLRFFSIFLIPAGTFSFFLYHTLKFKDFFLFFKVESSGWGRSFQIDKNSFLLFSNPAKANLIMDILFLAAALLAAYFVFRKLRTSYGLYMLSTILVAATTGTLMSIGRYILILFPIYILFASIKNKYFLYAVIFLSILLLASNITLFVNNYWAG